MMSSGTGGPQEGPSCRSPQCARNLLCFMLDTMLRVSWRLDCNCSCDETGPAPLRACESIRAALSPLKAALRAALEDDSPNALPGKVSRPLLSTSTRAFLPSCESTSSASLSISLALPLTSLLAAAAFAAAASAWTCFGSILKKRPLMGSQRCRQVLERAAAFRKALPLRRQHHFQLPQRSRCSMQLLLCASLLAAACLLGIRRRLPWQDVATRYGVAVTLH